MAVGTQVIGLILLVVALAGVYLGTIMMAAGGIPLANFLGVVGVIASWGMLALITWLCWGDNKA